MQLKLFEVLAILISFYLSDHFSTEKDLQRYRSAFKEG